MWVRKFGTTCEEGRLSEGSTLRPILFTREILLGHNRNVRCATRC
jgi:hypothetical protein